MDIPFTPEQFFDVFRRYNEAVWPAQWVLYALALLVVVLAVRGTPRLTPIIAGILGAFWLWMAGAYHLAFFAAINPAAWLFALLFLAQTVLFAEVGTRDAMAFRARPDVPGVLGALLIVYALVVYPMLGWMLGHRYPASPTFGLPCPTTIFTFGVLLWADGHVPRRLLIVPLVWAAIGTSAALSLGVVEDLGLGIAAVIALVAILARNLRARVHRPLDAPAHRAA